jgi:murein DD-endopeptidase MepM/ murein hydrolase activator NlpD
MISNVNSNPALLATLSHGEKEIEPKALAAKMQAMFMEVMIKTMEDSVEAEDGLFGGSASAEIYRGMLREQYAAAISGQVKSPLEEQIQTAVDDATAGSGSKSEIRGSGEAATNKNPKSEIAPLDPLPVSGVISSPMGWRRDPIHGGLRFHKGLDIAAPSGTPVKAVTGGTVVESGLRGGYGNTVVIQADDGRRMLFAHNQQNFVRVGDRVERGEAIAEVGSSGRSTGPHVHFEVSE